MLFHPHHSQQTTHDNVHHHRTTPISQYVNNLLIDLNLQNINTSINSPTRSIRNISPNINNRINLLLQSTRNDINPPLSLIMFEKNF